MASLAEMRAAAKRAYEKKHANDNVENIVVNRREGTTTVKPSELKTPEAETERVSKKALEESARAEVQNW